MRSWVRFSVCLVLVMSPVKEINKRDMGMQKLRQRKLTTDEGHLAKSLWKISEEFESDTRTVKRWNEKLCDGEDTAGQSKRRHHPLVTTMQLLSS